ncbi:MAG: STAS domain-containing protein [Planctomycetes bacterium]|nr:STAS domain-containing protein [Planctomycetota bacterium]
MTLHLESARDERGICVRVAGNLERQTYNECVRAVWSEHERTPADVRLDIGGVGRITSVAVAGLWRLAHELAGRQAALVVCNVPEPLRAMLSACGLASDPESTDGTYRFPLGARSDPAPGPAPEPRTEVAPVDARAEAQRQGERIADLERQLAEATAAAESERTRAGACESAAATLGERLRRVEEAYERLEGEDRTRRRELAEKEARIHQLLKHLRSAHQAFRDMAAKLEGMMEVPSEGQDRARGL